ncbi:hypothetical protein ACHWQZ_G013584 [Mnemiopsis leidyi]
MSVFVEERLRWLEGKLSLSLLVKSEQIKALFSDACNKDTLLDFLNNEDIRRLFVGVEGSVLSISLSQPPSSEKCIVFLKAGHVGKVRKDAIEESVMLFDLSKSSVEQIEGMMDSIFVPLILTEDSHRGEKMMENLHKLASVLQISAGNERGDVVLPVPLLDVLLDSAVVNNSVIVILETTVISWTKQIRIALKLDLDKALKAQKIVGPLAELKVWEERQSKLNSILSQLDCRLASQILKELSNLGNVYAKSFSVVVEDIKQALTETEDNIMYLRPLEPYLKKLAEVSTTDKCINIIAPIVHLLDLIWRHSRYYHEPKNFKRLLRHLSTLVVSSAHRFVGHQILSNTESAFTNLKHALKLCAKFRGCYLDKREKCNEYNKEQVSQYKENKKSENGIKMVTGPFITMHMKRHYGMFSLNNTDTEEKDPDMWTNSPWPARNTPPFTILNSFMERANDVLDLVQTAQHFKNLESVAEIGGVGNKSLDTIVTEIHARFDSAMKSFMTLTEQNVLDVSKQDELFEQEFFEFRALVRDLENQMAHVMRICFDRCANTSAHIRLLEVFAGVSGRESVQRALSDKLSSIVSGMMDEVLDVKDMLDRNMSAPNHKNMPDAASHMCWLRALRERIVKPMEKLRGTIPELLNNNDLYWRAREESVYSDSSILRATQPFSDSSINQPPGWKLRVQYDAVLADIDESLTRLEHVWRKDIKTELTSKLTQNLYVNIDNGPLIKVNLDHSLLLVLKEVQFISDPSSVPATVRTLIDQVDTNTLKVTAARLETIASHYNKLRSKIRPHEEQLFTAKITQIETLLKQGKESLTWKSLETDDFIEEATSLLLEDCYKKLQAVQAAQSQIEAKVTHWHEYLCQSLFTSDEPCFIEDWIVKQKEVSEGYAVLANMYGSKISSVVKEVHKLLQVSENSPAWQSYTAFLDDLISTGLIGAMRDALTQLYNLIALTDPADKPKILVRVELVGGMVQYHPPIDKESADISVQEMVFNWVTQMVEYCELIPRLMPDCESYAKVIGQTPEIIDLISKIRDVMDDNHHSCQLLQDNFMKYNYLWRDDAHFSFSQFISGKSLPLSSSSQTVNSEDNNTTTNNNTNNNPATSRPNSMLSSSVILGNAERNFLAPSVSTGSGSIGRVPTLDDFDKKISAYQSAFNAINGSPDESAIGWLFVDIKPIKQVLLTHASRWVYVFTEYLINQCTKMLGSIEEFLLDTEPQIEILIKTLSASPSDAAIAPSAYMKLVELFNKVTSKQQEFDSRFGVVRKTVVLLNKYNFKMEKEEFFLAAPSRWSNLRAKVVLAKQRIAPKMQLRSEQISHDLREFASLCQKSREEFAGCEAFLRTCSYQDAHDLTKRFKVRVADLEDRSRNLVELQELLEAHIVDFTCISEFRSDIETLEKVWNTSKSMKAHHSLWRNGQWKSLNLSSISHETECQILELKSLPENSHIWDVYCGLMENIKEIKACVPLIKSLSNSSMRPRHWKMLVRTLGAQHTIVPDKFQEASLNELLELGLLNYKDEVLAICQRAETDVQMEFSLQNCEEVWLSKVFELKSITRKRINGDSESNGRMELVKTTRDSQVLGSFSESRSRAFSIASKDSKLTDQNSYRESEPVSILAETDSIFECLWHHEMILDSIMGPGSAFSDDISKWQRKLQTVEQALKTWVSVQTKWLEMEEMFSMINVILSLNTHARVYAHVDLEFTHMMKSVGENPNIVQQCCKPGILVALKSLLEKLETCERALIDFTHKQCSRFPRFYFLAAKDVFHIMCHGHDLVAMSSYISRLLPAVSALQIDPESASQPVTALSTPTGETLILQEPVPTDIEIFNWLSSLLDVMKTSVTVDLNLALQSAVFEFEYLNEENWIFQSTSESVLLSVQIILGKKLRDCHQAVLDGSNKGALQEFSEELGHMIGLLQKTLQAAGEELRPRVVAEVDLPPSDDELPRSVSQNVPERSRRETPALISPLVLSAEVEKEVEVDEEGKSEAKSEAVALVPHQLEKVRNLIFTLLGLRNLTDQLIEEAAISPDSFTLKSQLCYSMSENHLVVSALNKSYKYGYEYQGTCPKIVSTPDTDRARLALFAACLAYNGSVLLSHRGSGKTELTRDISRCMGETLYMFSVTASTSLQSVRDICLGMASSGCHVCLEGMPSLIPGVLSLLVVAVRDIMSAISQKEEIVKVLDHDVPLKLTGRCFGTSLPTPCAKLSDLTQGVFRLVTLTQPEERTIYEALLLTNGFVFAGELATKLVSLLESFKALVQPSVYSLNNAKAWFADAADRREYVVKDDEEPTLAAEEEVLLLAIRDILTPRLTEEHVVLLHHLFSTFYPGVNFNRTVEEDMTMTESRLQVALQSASDLLALGKSETAVFVDPKEALVSVLKESGISPSVPMIAKLSQLALLLSTQKIVIVVGEAGCGKTTCINTVSQAHRVMGTAVNTETVVTQALKTADLFGSYSDNSCLWEDGLFSLLLNQFSAMSEAEGLCWLVLDGLVTPGQLDTLTTILHSDSTLLLPNSARIKAGENVRVIWEMEDLSSLSPTTCATAGIFVISSDPELWCRVLEQQLCQHDSEELIDTAISVISSMARFVESHKVEFAVRMTLESVVMTFCAIVASLVQAHSLETALVESLVVFAASWAYGGILQPESQIKFNDYVLKTWPFPQTHNDSTIWDCVLGDSCVLLPESPTSPTAGLSNEVNTGIPFVHTHRMKRCIHVMNMCTNVQRPVLLVGEMGVGKTLLMREKLRNSQALEGLQVTLNCDNFTDGYVLSNRLHEHMEWKAANYYDPKNSRYLICFIDNLNMAKVEEDGQMTVSETIRQHIDHTFIFSKSTMSLNHLRNTVYNVTCGLNHKLSTRFSRHFAAFVLHYPEKAALKHIFSAVTKSKLSSCSINSSKFSELSEDRLSQEEITQDLVGSIIRITIEVQDRLRSMYLPTKERCHYLFTLRSISNIFRNLLVSLKPKDNTAKDLLMLWSHEMSCGYSYRMISTVDKERFQQTFAMSAKKYFSKEDYVALCTAVDPPLFSSIVGSDAYHGYEGSEGALREYRAMPDSGSVVTRMRHNISEFVKHFGSINIELYESTISLISRVVHVLQNPHDIGHVLLVADGCADIANKVAAIAASILGAAVVSPSYSPENPSSYSLTDFCADFTSAIVEAGVKGKKIMFLLQEHEAADPEFLVHVSEYVSSCSVAGLFSAEEQVNIGNSLRSDLTQAGISFNHEIAFQFFLKNVQENLRVVMTTTTDNCQLWEWSSRYPSMLNCINVMWLPHWDSVQLLHVSKYHLNGIKGLTEKEKSNLGHLLTNIHKATSPDGTFNNTDFENFVKKFVEIFQKQGVIVQAKRKHLEQSLTCIRKVSSHAGVLEARLAREATVLSEKDAGVNNILVQLGRDTAIIEAHKLMLKQQQDKVGQIQQALPQLEIQRKRFQSDSKNIKLTIKDTLGQLTSASLTELRSINKPDSHIEDIIVAVIMLLKSPMADLTWNKGGKRLLAGIDRLIELLHAFDENPLPDKALESVTQLLGSHAFSPEFQAQDHAISCVPILSLWVVGVVKYHVHLLNKVQPAIVRVEKATQALDIARQKLAVMESKINVLQERLDGLQGSYEQATIDKDHQNSQTIQMRGGLAAAVSFTDALKNMEKTWSNELASIPLLKEHLEGSAAIAAASSVYMGSYPYSEQLNLPTEKWLPCLSEHSISVKLNTDKDLTSRIVSMLPGYIGQEDRVTPPDELSLSDIFTLIAQSDDLLKWDVGQGSTQAHLLGLVSSQFSSDGEYAPKFPLLIDPDGIGYQRILEWEYDNKLVTIDMSNSESRAIAALGRAISLGLPTVLLNIGTDIPPLIYPLFEQRRHIDGDVETIKLGGQKFQYNRKFRLYLATTEPEEAISKTLLSYTPVIQFTLTPPLVKELLQASLLAILFPAVGWVQQAVPKKIALVSAELETTCRLLSEKLGQEVETEITGLNNLLSQQDQLNETLSKLLLCKEKCKMITDSLSPIITRCSILHSAMQSLATLNTKYAVSFKTFKAWIVDAIEKTEAPQIIATQESDIPNMGEVEMLHLLESLVVPDEARVESILQTVTSAIWDTVSLSIFRDDSLVVSVLFSVMVATDINQLPYPVFQVLTDSLGGEDRGSEHDLVVIDRPEWVASEDEWQKICALEEVPALKGLSQMIDNSWDEWLEEWNKQPSPGIWHATRPQAEACFYDILILHVLRPLRVREAMINYVATVEPAFSSSAKMLTLSDLGAGKPLLLVYDRCPNKLVNYLETNLVEKEDHVHMITVGSNTSDLNSVFTDEGCLILHKIQLGSEEWRSVLHQQISVLNRKFDLAAQDVMGLLNALGSLSKKPSAKSGVSRCILTVDRDSHLHQGLVKLCNVVSVDTLIPPIDTLHLPSLCASNVPSSELSSKTMRIAVLHGIIQHYWTVYKDQPECSVSLTMALEETQNITDIQDIINILTEVVYRSMLETRQERELVTCLTERIFSVPNSVLLDSTTPIRLPTADGMWVKWVEDNIPVSLDFIGLNQSVIENRVLVRNAVLSGKLGQLLEHTGITLSSPISPLVVVQRRIVEYMEILPPALPARIRTSKAVGGSELYRYWLSLEIEHFTSTRDTISRDLENLHAKLIQGFSTLSDDEFVIYTAIYRNKPPQSWLYQSVSPERFTNVSWIKILTEARAQLITLHEGGSGIWAGCLADPRVLIHSLLQEKAETDGVSVSQVSLKINLLENMPATERTQLVTLKGGVLLSGIKLIGADWDTKNQRLKEGATEFKPDLVHIYASSEEVPDYSYSCPLYLDQQRCESVVDFQLSSKVPVTCWALLSVSLVVVRTKPRFMMLHSIAKYKTFDSSSLFDIQSKEQLHANKALVRTSSFAIPRSSAPTPATRALSASSPRLKTGGGTPVEPAPLSPLTLQPTPPPGSKPGSRRKSVASQILERKSQSRSRNGSRSVSPLANLGRTSHSPVKAPGELSPTGSENGDKILTDPVKEEVTPPVSDDEMSLPPMAEEAPVEPAPEREVVILTPAERSPPSDTSGHPDNVFPVSITPKLKTVTPYTVGSIPPDTLSDPGSAKSDPGVAVEPIHPQSPDVAATEQELPKSRSPVSSSGVLSKPQSPIVSVDGQNKPQTPVSSVGGQSKLQTQEASVGDKTKPQTPVASVGGKSKPQTPIASVGGQSKPQTPVASIGGQSKPQTPVASVGGQSKPQTPVASVGGQSKPQTPVASVGGQSKPQTPVASIGGQSKPQTPVASVGGQSKPQTPVASVGGQSKPQTPVASVGGQSKPQTPVAPGGQGKPQSPVASVGGQSKPTTPAAPIVVETKPQTPTALIGASSKTPTTATQVKEETPAPSDPEADTKLE